MLLHNQSLQYLTSESIYVRNFSKNKFIRLRALKLKMRQKRRKKNRINETILGQRKVYVGFRFKAVSFREPNSLATSKMIKLDIFKSVHCMSISV